MKRRFFIFFLVLIYLFNNIFVSTTLGKFVDETTSEKFNLMAISLEDGMERPTPEQTLISGYEFNEIIQDATSITFDIYSTTRYSNFTWGEGEILDISSSGNIQLFKNGTEYYILSEKTIFANEDCSMMFSYLPKLKEIIFNNFNTSQTTNMSDMFHFSSLTELDITMFDTSKVTNMTTMFSFSSNLTELDLSSFDTSNVVRMIEMFGGMTSLEHIYVDSAFWNVENVEESHGMFASCKKLPNFDENYIEHEKAYVGVGGYLTECTKPSILIDGKSFNSLIPSNATSITFDTYSTTNYPNFDWETGISVDEKDLGEIKLFNNGTDYYVLSNNLIYANSNSYRLFYSKRYLTDIKFLNFNTSNVTDMSYMFSGCTRLVNVDVSNWDTSKVTTINHMFDNCSNITTLDVSKWNTSNITDMGHAFFAMSKVTHLDVSKWNTANVTTMHGMFSSCKTITEIDVSNFNTLKVTNMKSMFDGCSSLQTVDLSSFDTTNVDSFYRFFYNCSALKTVNLSSFDTSNVTDLYWMFYNCSSLETIDLSNFDTSKVTNMSGMFYNCSSLETIDLSNFNTSKVTTMSKMFSKCTELIALNISNFNTFQVTSMEEMFSKDAKLEHIYVDAEQWYPLNTIFSYIGYDDMFADCVSLPNFDNSFIDYQKAHAEVGGYLTDFNNRKFNRLLNGKELNAIFKSLIPTNNTYSITFGNLEDYPSLQNLSGIPVDANGTGIYMAYVKNNNIYILSMDNSTIYANKDSSFMFHELSKLTSINFDNFDTSTTWNMEQMFAFCYELEEINVSSFNTENVVNMLALFVNCESLKSIDLSSFNTNRVIDMQEMFHYCLELTEIKFGDAENHQNTALESMYYMFADCPKLESIDLSSFYLAKQTLSHAFYNCTNLKEITFNKNQLVAGKDFEAMFYNCHSLVELDISNFSFDWSMSTKNTFYNCYNLEYIYIDTNIWIDEEDPMEPMDNNDMFYNCVKLPNFNSSVIDYTNAHANEGGYLTDINQKSTLDLLPPFEMPDGFISGKSFIIFELPDFKEITNQAIEDTPENTEFYGWLIENEMAQQIFEPEDAEYILEDTYSYGEKVELRLTPVYKVLEVEKEVTEVLNGNNSVYDINNPEVLTFRSEAPLAELESVEINGITLIKDTDYTATEGSTIITLSKDYLSTLEIGNYTISIISTNMIANATFKVEKVEEEKEEEKNIKNVSFNIEQLFNIEIAEFVDLEDDYIEIEEDLELEFVLEEDYVLYKDIEVLIDDNLYILNLTDEEQELESINFNVKKSILTIAYDLFENNSTLTIKAHALENIPLDELVSVEEISITEFTNSDDLYEMLELSENEEFIGWLINEDELEIHNIVLQDNLTDILTKIYGEQIEQEESINSLDTVPEDVVLPGDKLVAPEEELITTTLKPVLRIKENKQVEIDLSKYVLGEMISVNDTIETFDELLTLATNNTPDNTEFYGWFIEYFNNEEIIIHDELSSTILAIYSNGEITDKSVNLTPLYITVEQETTEPEQPEEKVEESTEAEDVPQEEQNPDEVEKNETSEIPEENTSTDVKDGTIGNEPENDANNSVEDIPTESIPTENTILINTDKLENINISNLNEDNIMSYTDNLTLQLEVDEDYKLPSTVEIVIDKTYTINIDEEDNPNGFEFINSKIIISAEYLTDIDAISINATAVLIEEQIEDETTSQTPEEDVSPKPNKVEQSTSTESTEQESSQEESNEETEKNKTSETPEENTSTEIEESTTTGAEPENDANNPIEDIPTESEDDIASSENVPELENPESSNNVENETPNSEPTSLPENNFVPDNIKVPDIETEESVSTTKSELKNAQTITGANNSESGLKNDIVSSEEPDKATSNEVSNETAVQNNISESSNVTQSLTENTVKVSEPENTESSVTSVSVTKTVTVKESVTDIEPNKSATSTENSSPTNQKKSENIKTVPVNTVNNTNSNSEKETSNSKTSTQNTVNETVKNTNVQKETSNVED